MYYLDVHYVNNTAEVILSQKRDSISHKHNFLIIKENRK